MDNSNNDTLVTALLQKMVDEAVDQKLDSVVAELKDMVDLCLKEVDDLAKQVGVTKPMEPTSLNDEVDKMIAFNSVEDLQRRLEYVERNYSLQKEYYDDWFKRYGNKLLKKAKEDFVWCRRSVGAHQTWQKRKDNKNLINGTARKKEQTDG
tara:strand:+ start:361 stop:813 length:453 start_codon:yes stop_codon:yes gene_type:complete